MEHRKKGSAKKSAAIAIGTAAVCIALIVAAIFLLGKNEPDTGKNDGTSAETSAESAHTTVEMTDPSTEPVITTPGDSETADPVTTEVSTEDVPDVPVTDYVPPENRDTDFSGCLFIGDSRTEGLMLYSGISGATAYTARGLMVDTYFTAAVVNMNGEKVTVADAVESNPNYKKVYVMLGVNELGWPYESVFGDCYGKLIDHLKETMPDAEINVQSIIPVTAKKSAGDKIYNNEKIALFNGVIRDVCAEKGVNYVDLIPGICGDPGVLPEDAAFDGVHLQMSYCKRWLDCLKEITA